MAWQAAISQFYTQVSSMAAVRPVADTHNDYNLVYEEATDVRGGVAAAWSLNAEYASAVPPWPLSSFLLPVPLREGTRKLARKALYA